MNAVGFAGAAAHYPASDRHDPVEVGFFQHHGIWAPGVRLFRTLQFRSKALIITTVFLLPTALLTWTFLNAKRDSISFSVKERDGVTYLRDAVPLVGLAQVYRMQALQAHARAVSTTPELVAARRALGT